MHHAREVLFPGTILPGHGRSIVRFVLPEKLLIGLKKYKQAKLFFPPYQNSLIDFVQSKLWCELVLTPDSYQCLNVTLVPLRNRPLLHGFWKATM